MAMLTRKEMRDKAERTTLAATEIIQNEKQASEAKTARLKALRATRNGESGAAPVQRGRHRAS